MQLNRRRIMIINTHTAPTNRQAEAACPRSPATLSKTANAELTETDLGWVSGGRRDPYKN
jgi:hypothetical protein